MITCEEKFSSREVTLGEGEGAILTFIIKGTDDEIEALDALNTTAPQNYQDIPRQSRSVEPVGPSLWLGMARYGYKQTKQTGESLVQFDTAGGSQHITQSIQTVGSYAAPGKTAGNFGGAIGVNESSVEGVDITVPVFNFSQMHYLDDVQVDSAYQQVLFELTGKVNNALWQWFEAGEVLFLGASGAKRGRGDWEITYRFAASQNRSGIVIGDIAGISKKGWEYLWVRYQDSEDTGAQSIVKRPISVYVERVYEEANFALLGI